MRVIGLTGRARSGKGTVADMIVEALPDHRVVCEGFSDRLKVSAAHALGFQGEPAQLIEAMDWLKLYGSVSACALPGVERVTVKVSGREYLQRYGTEAHRGVFGEDFWVDAVLPMSPLRDDCDVLVLTDMRFANEATRAQVAYGGSVWNIVRPGSGIAESTHPSEAGLPDHLIDAVVTNDGTLDDLRSAVGHALVETL